MKIKKSETCFNGKYLKLKRKYFKTKNGKIELWEYVERKTFGHPIVIFAITKDKKVILEKIYRIPLESWVIELPAGLQDRKEESEKEVARRELLEETGYRAEKLTRIFQGPISPGTSKEEAIYYFAKDVIFEKEPEKEDTEEIKIIKVPVKELIDFIERKSKKMKVDSKILSIFPILQKKKLI